MSTPFQSVLFIELLGGIGDLLIALPAIQALARSHPTAKLTVLTFAPGAELLHHDPLIHQVISLDRQPHSPPDFIPQTIKALLQQQAFDLIVSDTNYDSIDQIIQQSSAVTNLWRSPPPDQRVGDRFGEILLAEGVIQQGTFMSPQLHLTAAEIDRAQQKLQNLNRPFIVLILDAGMTIKCWSTDCFIIVGQTLQKQYHATIVIPVGADREQAMQVVNQIGGNVMIWERGTLRELAAMLAIADLTIAADTGPARIAAALGTPTITLFGPSWSDRYGQPSPHINLQGYPNCPERNIGNFTLQPCWYSGVCPYDWRTCLEDISTAEVLRSAAKLLEPRSISLPIASPTSPWLSARNILVIRLDNIGDVLMISPALQAIKATLPDCRLTLMASPSGAQAAALLPWVDEVLPVRSVWQDMGKLAFDPVREGELIQNIRDRQFDAAIVFTSFSQTPHAAGYLCYLAGIPLRAGQSKEWGGSVLTTEVKSIPDDVHQVERNLYLIESLGFCVRDRSLQIRIPARAQRLLPDPYLVLNPWTSCPARNYSPARFAIAARELSDITGYPVVVTGVAKDRQHSDELLQTLGDRAINLIGMTDLADLAALIAHAKLLLSNNTSTMHLADATRTPSVILFAGTEHESQWRPRHTAAHLLRQPTPCSPCYGFTCPYDMECLDIPPEQVVEAGIKLLSTVCRA